jgi:hypothetical protein
MTQTRLQGRSIMQLCRHARMRLQAPVPLWIIGSLILLPCGLRAEDQGQAKPAELPPLIVVGLAEPTFPQAREEISGVPGGATIVDSTDHRQ